ncbi:cytochrome P450 [Saccharomonospora halophila]|uniref:cytochrome P450 n=1 Tax=Saccharomonospora halophila TaxID=129922 RepID=UPI0003763CC6|nr:cytochrome P450 [Saccharomonospora halophila]
MTTTSRQNPSLAEMTDLMPLSATTNCADPQSAYSELRARWGQVAPVELEPGIPGWLVLGHPEICNVARNERLFSRDPHNWRMYYEGIVSPDSGLGPMMFPRDNAYFADGDKHRRLRAPIEDALEGMPEHQLAGMVRQTCTDLIGRFVDRGAGDLVADYAAVIPMLVVGRMFGFGMDQAEEFRQGLLALFGSGEDSQAGNRRVEEMLNEIIHARRAEPAADVTSAFLDSGNLRDDYEIEQSMVLMVSAGYETTMTWIAQTLRLMLTDDRFGGRLRGGRLGLDEALDEVLWRDPPMTNMPARYALADCDLAGRRIDRGDALILGFAAANADSRVHSGDPWLEVGNRSYLAYSTGPHTCPAQRTSRIITRIAVDTALHLLHDVVVAVPAEQITPIPSPWTRCPASLPVRFARSATVHN